MNSHFSIVIATIHCQNFSSQIEAQHPLNSVQANPSNSSFPLPSALDRASQVLQGLRICLRMQDTQEVQIRSLGQDDPLVEEMETHSRILAWEIPRTEESGGLQSMGLQRVRCD